jgi:hypothetical protein
MANKGGISTLKGVKYEIQAVLYEIPDLLNGQLKAIRYQPVSSALSPSQLPTDVFVDDYSTETEDGTKSFFQAKQNTKDNGWTILRLLNEGVIQAFWKQHCEEPESRLFFVSNIPAQPLQNLADHARQTASPEEFQQRAKKDIHDDTAQVIEKLEIPMQGLWNMLRRANHRLQTDDMMQKRIMDYASGRYADVNKFTLVLRDLIEKSPGTLLTQNVTLSHLKDKGLFPLSSIPTQDIQTILCQASGSLRAYRSNIFGVHIEREETEDIEKWIDTEQDKCPVAFLLDVAGTGKSVILHDLLQKLEKRGIPALAIKADVDLSGRDTDANSSGSTFGNLPDIPESLLATAVAEHKKAVLIIDQLDALSLTFSRNQLALDKVIGLIGRAASIEGVRVVISCRSFDRRFDPKLRQIQAAKEFRIKPLTESQIEQVLDRLELKWQDLSSREQELLANPHNLDLFTAVVSEAKERGIKRQPINTVQNLYDELWELKIEQANSPDVSTGALRESIYVLVDAIHKSQELYQPVSSFDKTPEARKYLESQGIFRREGKTLAFFHQSFFDYCYARQFVQQTASLSETVRKGDQGFFVRPQIVQTLDYLRGIDQQRYLYELEALMDRGALHRYMRQFKKHPGRFNQVLFSTVAALKPPIRYHIRHLVFAWFGQQRKLADQEKALGLSCLQTSDDRRLFMIGAQGNPEWFDVIRPRLDELLALPDDKALNEEIVPFLRSVEEERADGVFGILANRLGGSKEWNNRVIWCLSSYKGWHSKEAAKCLLWLCQKTESPWNSLDLVFHNLAKENPELGCEALKAMLERLKKQWQKSKSEIAAYSYMQEIEDEPKDEAAIAEYIEHMHQFRNHSNKLLPGQLYWLDELMNQASEEYPSKLIAVFLPWLEQVLPDLVWRGENEGLLRDDVFSECCEYPSHTSASAVIQGFRQSLSRLAEHNQEQFLSLADRMGQSRYLAFHQILAQVLTDQAQRHASWACQYLLRSTLHFQIGTIGSTTIFSRKLVGAIFPHLNPNERRDLEQAILSYYPDWEKIPQNRHGRGSDQFELLWEVPDELLTDKGREARGVLRRKFQGYQPVEQQSMMASTVGSPIPEEKTKILSDDAWLNAMRHYDDTTDWDSEFRRGSLKGGVVELSRSLEKVVETEPERFAGLAYRFDETVSSQYFGALLNGLANSQVSSSTVFTVCENFAEMRPDDEIVQRAICRAVEKRYKDDVPIALINLVRGFALSASDPDHENWQEKASDGQYYYRGDPHLNGINTVRGSAARVYIASMLESSFLDTDSLLGTMESVAGDPLSAVRSCLIEMLRYVLRIDSDRVVDIFETAVDGRPELLECRVSGDFIYHALGRYSIRMLNHIEKINVSENDKVQEIGGQLTTLAHFFTPEAMVLYRRCLSGSAALRRGVAKVLARNVDQPELLKLCLDGLEKLHEDQDQEVRGNIGHAFEYLPPPIQSEITRFIHKLLRSNQTVVDAARNITLYAERIRLEYPKLAIQIAEQMQLVLGRDIVDIRKSSAILEDDLINIAVAIQTHSDSKIIKARALDLFERVMDLGSRTAAKVLSAADR